MKYLWIDEFLLSFKGATKDYKAEWEWTRYLIKDKMFAAICKDAKGEKDIITIKLDQAEGEFLRKQYSDINLGHYMNKVHWNSINLDGEVEDELMKQLLTKSYKLVLSGLSKKLQKEIEES